MLRKTKAIFQIIIIILSIFTIYLINAKQVNAVTDCCEKVGTNFCQPSLGTMTGTNCAPTDCSLTSFCKPGTCYADNSCMLNVPKAACDAVNGQWFDKTADQIPECKLGCCIVGNNCNLQTKDACEARTPADYPLNFQDTITDEPTCIYQCTKQDKGCCVSPDGCTYTSRDACDSISGTFSLNQLCSSVADCPDCKAHDHKACKEDSTDLYWYDSCNNIEDVAQQCNFPLEKCAEDLTNSGTYICRDLKCHNLWDNPFTSYTNTERINGESWCEYFSATGPGKDLPGAIHYREYCLDGVEYGTAAPFRDKICVYSNFTDPASGTTMSVSSLIKNRWEDCAGQQTKTECQNSDKRDCVWTGQNENKDSGSENFVYCVPLVPPGFKFWDSEGQDTCQQANIETKVLFNWDQVTGRWSILRNGDAYLEPFLVKGNAMCRTMGDCGSAYSVDCKYTNNYWRNCGNTHGKSCTKYLNPSSFGNCINDFKVAGLGLYVKSPEQQQFFDQLMSSWAGIPLMTSLAAFAGTIGAIGVIGSLSSLGGMTAIATTIGMMIPGGVATTGISAGLVGAGSGWTGLATATTLGGTFGPILVALAAVAIVLVVIIIALVIYTLLQHQVKENVSTSCNLWQAPMGSANCEKCNKPMSDLVSPGLLPDKNGKIIEGYECTEYLCNALGGGCKFEPQGIDGPVCIALNPHDVIPPIIKPNTNVMNFTCAEGSSCSIKDNGINGYEIQGLLKEYTKVTLAVSTFDENGQLDLTQCKYDAKLGTLYENMPNAFSEGKYSYNHNETIYNLLDGQNYKYYLKCADSNGNSNMIDYVISFTYKKAPDTTPPMIDFYEPLSGSFVKSGVNESEVKITVNEAVDSCKWDVETKPYDTMVNTMVCPTIAPGSTDAQTCTANVGPIAIGENKFYFTCKDISNNSNSAGQPTDGYTLIGTEPLDISDFNVFSPDCITQDTTVKCYTDNVTLEATTSGGAESGVANCKYSSSCETDGCMIDSFFETDAVNHKQVLFLPTGSYTFHALCSDSAGNTATASVAFSIEKDTTAPELVGVNRDTSYGDNLKIIILDDSEVKCEYSDEEFFLGNGTAMQAVGNTFFAPWAENGKTIGIYYIRCEDRFGNEMPMAVIHTSTIQD